ncbi:MAG: VOC family protein [Candidatus Latescibacteria bacterium]|nr:VOC family protein [Candidatus Latescibacterota bacterium]
MGTFRLPAEAHIHHIHLQVSNLKQALAFYANLLGFREVGRGGVTTILSATGRLPSHILLTEHPGAQPKPPHTTGLYHVAIRFPNRRELARVFRRLLDHNWSFHGFSDHKVSEALYLSDPDGNGLELYTDRPRDQWPWHDDQIAMTTDPLDPDSLLQEAAEDTDLWTGIHLGTDIGHVHLQVSDLTQAEAFYHGLLGLDVTQRNYPGALFLSAGGYHHHLGLNIWAGHGASPPPPDAVGLLSFALRIPDRETYQTLQTRIQAAGIPVEDWRSDEHTVSILVRDPDRNGVELLHNVSYVSR